MRLLVVDDDPDIVMSLCDRLIEMRHTVSSASDGQAALMALESDPVDLVLLDVDMPRLNGVETLRLIQKRWPELPVIMMTGLWHDPIGGHRHARWGDRFHHKTA